MKKILKWGAIGFAAIVIIGIIASATGGKKENNSSPIQSRETKSQYTYDVPSLIGKNVDEVKFDLTVYQKKTLEPTDEQIKLGVKEWDVSFEKDGKELLVTYIINNKKVKDFFISTDDPSGKTQNKNHLLEIGNLTDGSNRYDIEFVRTITDPSYFTGVKVIPSNK